MWSFRKEIHKVDNGIGKLGTTIDCDTDIQVTGNQGIYLLNVVVGTDTGIVNFNYDAINVPDRFELIYNGVVVADSKYVGDNLSGNTGALLNTFTLSEREYDGVQFITNGTQQTFTNTSSDIANGSMSEPTDGQGVLSFFKSTPTPNNVTVKVTAPLGTTAWNATLFCAVSSFQCGDNQEFNSPDGAGVYITEVQLGSDTGTVTLDYDATNIPDRFQIFYDGNLVADSLYVGGFLTGNPPNADTVLWEGGSGSGNFVGKTYNNIPELEWNVNSYVTTGNTYNFTVSQSDVAPFGSTAGAGQLSFTKTNASPETMTVVITSLPDNTGWDFTANCPLVQS